MALTGNWTVCHRKRHTRGARRAEYCENAHPSPVNTDPVGITIPLRRGSSPIQSSTAGHMCPMTDYALLSSQGTKPSALTPSPARPSPVRVTFRVALSHYWFRTSRPVRGSDSARPCGLCQVLSFGALGAVSGRSGPAFDHTHRGAYAETLIRSEVPRDLSRIRCASALPFGSRMTAHVSTPLRCALGAL